MKITFKLVQRTAYCSCGDQITVKGTNPSKAIALWREGHKGPGCGVCDRRTAVRARVKRAAAAAEVGGENQVNAGKLAKNVPN